MTELWRLPASDIRSGIGEKKFSAREVIESSLSRLAAVNPTLNAVVQEMPEQALADAERIDRAIAAGDDPGELAGVPVTIKVNIDQAGFANTNGLVMQKDHVAERDNPVVENLKNAGAIVVGRTNTPAFSMRWFTNNRVHGHTLNPHNPILTPGGSSGGAASATAAGICAIGHGTDIAGSVRYPAYACGLHGLRPTLGRIPAWNPSLPDRHIAPQITAVSGPLARTVEDCRLGYEAMSQSSPLDPWWVPVARNLGKYPRSAVLCVSPEGLVVKKEVEAALREAARCLEDAGWTVIEAEVPPMRRPMQCQLEFWMSEMSLSNFEPIHRENDPDATFIAEQLQAQCEPTTLASLMGLMQERAGLVRDWQTFFEDSPLLICPVSGELPFVDQLDVESPTAFQAVVEAQMTQIAIPFVSVPAMTVTTGEIGGGPVGVQLVAGRYREDILFDAAREIESRAPGMGIAMPDVVS